LGGLIVNLTPPFVVLAVPFDDLGSLIVVLTPLIVNLGVLFVNSEAPFDEKMTPFDDLGTLFVKLRQNQMAKSEYSGFTASVGGKSIPAATVALVPCSMRMNEPVSRLVV
jgi:hypothetical protein